MTPFLPNNLHFFTSLSLFPSQSFPFSLSIFSSIPFPHLPVPFNLSLSLFFLTLSLLSSPTVFYSSYFFPFSRASFLSLTYHRTRFLFGVLTQTTNDGNVTTSTLTLKPEPPDDGTSVTCRAENLATDTVLEQSLALVVYCELVCWSVRYSVVCLRLVLCLELRVCVVVSVFVGMFVFV